MDTGKLTVKGLLDSTQACKAWVNFNGTGVVAIRGGYNVSSITDNAKGDYTVNFTNAMVDGNYAVSGSGMEDKGIDSGTTYQAGLSLASKNSMLAGSVRVLNFNVDANYNVDGEVITVIVHR